MKEQKTLRPDAKAAGDAQRTDKVTLLAFYILIGSVALGLIYILAVLLLL